MDLGYLETNIQAVNALAGGLPVGSGLLIYGPPEAGKTILEFQMAYEALQADQNVLIIDTEGSDHTYADWYEKFNARYKVDAGIHFVKAVHRPVYKKSGNDEIPVDVSRFDILVDENRVKEKKLNIFIFGIREVTEILALVGKPVEIEPSPNGKFSVKPQPGWKTNPLMSELGRFVKKYNIGYVAMDSVTQPTARAIGTEQANLPARAQIISFLLATLQALAEKAGLALVMVSHENKPGNTNPTDKFKHPAPLGGDAVMYHVKYAVYMSHEPSTRTPSTDKYKAPTREFWVARHPSRQPWTMYRFIKLTNDGFIDQ